MYLISIIVDEYGTDRELKASIIVMSEHLTTKTFSILNQPNGFKQNPDLVDDFYRLSARLLQRCPLEYLKSNVIQPIIEQILPNCNLEHRDASASMMAFLQSLVKLTSTNKKESKNNSPEIRSLALGLCDNSYPNILTGLIRAILIDRVPSAIRLSISEFVYDLKSFLPEKFSQWLKKSINDIPRTSLNGLVEIVTLKQQDQFYQILSQFVLIFFSLLNWGDFCRKDLDPSAIDEEFEIYARLYR